MTWGMIAWARRSIAAEGGDIAADGVQEAVQLALRVVEAAGLAQPYEPPKIAALPCALRTRSISAGGDVERLVPGQRDEVLAAAPAARPCLSSQPRRIEGRATRLRWCTAAGMIAGIADGCGSAANGRVATMRSVFDIDLEGPPMARGHPRLPSRPVGH